MKKTLLLFVLFIVLAFGGCAPAASELTQKVDPTHEVVESVEPTAKPTTKPTPEPEPDYYFEDGVLVTPDYKIEIVGFEVVKQGANLMMSGDEILFTFDVTNISGADVSPSPAWISSFTAVQDNDPNVVNELDMGFYTPDEYVDVSFATLKAGGTVRSAISYTLDDAETPVVLRANRGAWSGSLGEQTFDISAGSDPS